MDTKTINTDLTISEARSLMRPQLKKGVICPCCLQRSQLYVRSLTSSMMYGLILMVREVQKVESDPRVNVLDHTFHLESFFKEKDIPASIRADIAKLRFWGFLEALTGKREDGNPNTGYYRLTQKGINFALGKVLVQKSIKMYNGEFRGLEGPEIDVWGAIKNKFNYSDLMGGK